MARVKMVTMANPNIPNMTFLANLMELKKGKFTAEVTQMVHGVADYMSGTRTVTAQIWFENFEKLEAFCNQMGLKVEDNPAWMTIQAFERGTTIVPVQTSFDFSGNQEVTE